MGEIMKTARIVVVDDHPLLRQGVVKALSTEPEFKIVGEGSTAADAVALAVEQRPDILLLDLDIPGGGLEALRKVLMAAPTVSCVILTVCDRAETAITAMNAGARGYILKGVGIRELKAALKVVLGNESFISPEFAARLLQAAQQKLPAANTSDRLSVREEQVLELVEDGLTNREIADRLNLSERTVKHYMSVVMQKYGVKNRVSAMVQYRDNKARPGAMTERG